VRGADNQQERPGELSQAHAGNPQRPHADQLSDPKAELKIWSGPYGDVGRPAETTGPPNVKTAFGCNRSSEIPCRVSSDLHEWRNDFPTVSTTDPAKLKYE
jgi:hypothetical protein